MDRKKMRIGLAIIWFVAGVACIFKGDYMLSAVSLAVGVLFLYKGLRP